MVEAIRRANGGFDMPDCYSIVEDRDRQLSRVLVEVDDCTEAETLPNDLQLRRQRVYLVRRQFAKAEPPDDRTGEAHGPAR
jgi:hypothetical protein